MSQAEEGTATDGCATLTRRGVLASALMAVVGSVMGKPRTRLPYQQPDEPVSERVRDLLSRMTLEEKVAQLCSLWSEKGRIVDGDGVFSASKAHSAIPHGIGQIGRPGDTTGTLRHNKTRFRDQAETIAFVNAVQRYHVEQTRLGIPALFHEETAHGYRARGATQFPIPPGLGSTWDPDLIERAFAVVGREGRLGGATIALSPVLDLARDPRFGRVEEFFGEDPYHVARMGIAAVRGQQGRSRPLGKDKLFVTLKHFVHGAPQGGINLAPADMSERTLRESFLVPLDRKRSCRERV